MLYGKALLIAAVTAEAVAFAPTSFPGLSLRGAAPAACAAFPVRSRLVRDAPRRVRVVVKQGLDKEGETAVDTFKKDGKELSILEKEQLYLEACASWNVEKKQVLSDDEFEDLKTDLTFQGSQVMMMNREEISFMVAQFRYNKGQPIMQDAEYEALRTKLRKKGSLAVKHDAASCKILPNGKKSCKADLFTDDGKQALLYTPALVLSALLFNEYAFWFNGWDPLFSLILGSPFIVAVTYGLTNYIYFQQPFITKTVCPSCGTPQNIYFGDVLFVGGKEQSLLKVNTKCVNKDCAVALTADKELMRVEAIMDV